MLQADLPEFQHFQALILCSSFDSAFDFFNAKTRIIYTFKRIIDFESKFLDI